MLHNHRCCMPVQPPVSAKRYIVLIVAANIVETVPIATIEQYAARTGLVLPRNWSHAIGYASNAWATLATFLRIVRISRKFAA
jgi:hypothetical protein